MCYKDNAGSALLQAAHHPEQLLHILAGKGCGGFIQDQHLGVRCQRAGDHQHLLLSDGQLPHVRMGIQHDMVFFQKLLRRIIHGFEIHKQLVLLLPLDAGQLQV